MLVLYLVCNVISNLLNLCLDSSVCTVEHIIQYASSTGVSSLATLLIKLQSSRQRRKCFTNLLHIIDNNAQLKYSSFILLCHCNNYCCCIYNYKHRTIINRQVQRQDGDLAIKHWQQSIPSIANILATEKKTKVTLAQTWTGGEIACNS